MLEAIANLLPLTYFIDLMRDIVLRHEQIWENWTDVAVVVAWGLVGLVVTVLRGSAGSRRKARNVPMREPPAARSARSPAAASAPGERRVERRHEPVDVLLGEDERRQRP